MSLIPLLFLVLFGSNRTTLAGIIVDPPDDAIGINITSLEVNIGGSNVDVSMTFTDLILPPSAGAPNSVTGFIEFDLDLDPSTGFNPGLVDFFGGFIGHPPTGLGVDGVILLGSELNQPGTVELNFASGLTGFGTLTTSSNTLNISFSRSLIGTTSELQFAAIVGDLNFVTDATGVGLASVSAVPEPSSLLTMSLAGLSLLTYRRRSELVSRL